MNNCSNEEPAYYYELATLGPSGTCSHQVGARFLHHKGLNPHSILLTPSFEEATEAVKKNIAKRILVPSAYRRHADIVFDNAGELTPFDVFPANTPEFFFLLNPNKKLTDVRRVASHASPRRLLDYVRGLKIESLTVVEATSNANAADLLANGDVDACLTVRSQRTESLINGGRAICLSTLGFITMTWVVLVRTADIQTFGSAISAPLL